MNRILSFLLCIVFLKAQVLAMTGGPNEGSESAIDVAGTYSGVLIPSNSEATLETVGGESLNSLGIFTIRLPKAGFGTGAFLIFSEGVLFSGTMTAVGDSGESSVKAIIEATYEYTDFVRDADGNPIFVEDEGFQTEVVTVPARGTVIAEVRHLNPSDLTTTQSSNFGRISGEAEIAVFGGVSVGTGGNASPSAVLRYTVDGVKQAGAPLQDFNGGGGGTDGGNNGDGGGGGGGGVLGLFFGVGTPFAF